ncbi:MAG: SDR family oxidoreductase [Pseudomonadota bacterium]|nr:MAG: SDR family oxidoreductase [Pseudomonadota bacterium]
MAARRVAFITGGGQGIGKAIAQRLLRDGWAAVIAEVDEEAGRQTEAELKALGPVRFQHVDVAVESQVRSAIGGTVAEFARIDALVNNAGISRNVPLADLALEDWQRVLGVNLTGAMLCARHAAPHLRAAHGTIVNIASTRAYMSEANTEAYSASKGGLVALTHALAVSLGPEVRVNCVSPGWIDVSAWRKRGAVKQATLSAADHSQHPVGRVGRPEDVAACVAYLLSEEAGFVTGANLTLDGGMTRKMIYV